MVLHGDFDAKARARNGSVMRPNAGIDLEDEARVRKPYASHVQDGAPKYACTPFENTQPALLINPTPR